MSDFWKTPARTTSGPLTYGALRRTWDELERRAEEARRAPYRCPHKDVVFPPALVRRHVPPEGIECPWGCGMRLVGPRRLVSA